MTWHWLMLHFCHCPGTTGSWAFLAVFSYLCYFIWGSLGPLISFQEGDISSVIRGDKPELLHSDTLGGQWGLHLAPLTEHSHSSMNSCHPKCHEVPKCNKHIGTGALPLEYFYLKSDSVLCIVIFLEVLVSKTFKKVLKSLPNIPVHKNREEH